MHLSCEIQYLQIRIQGKWIVSEHISETYQVHNQCSEITVLCCLAAQVVLDLPQPAKIPVPHN